MEKFYRPPKFGVPRGRTKRDSYGSTPGHSALWLVRVEMGQWGEEDYKQRETALPAARAAMKSERQFKIEKFLWPGKGLERLRRNEQVIQVIRSGRKKFIYPVGRVLSSRHYRVRRSDRAIVFLEVRKRLPKKEMKRALSQLDEVPQRFRRLQTPWLPCGWRFIYDQPSLW